jgi:hypothetical protein
MFVFRLTHTQRQVERSAETGTQCPRLELGYPVPGGNKYRNLALQVGGDSKIETINYAHESRGTNLRKAALAMPSKN